MFLDNATGDFYSFDSDDCRWKPNGNVGMHYSKALHFEPDSQALISRPVIYRSDALNGSLFLQKASDVKAYVDKIH